MRQTCYFRSTEMAELRQCPLELLPTLLRVADDGAAIFWRIILAIICDTVKSALGKMMQKETLLELYNVMVNPPLIHGSFI